MEIPEKKKDLFKQEILLHINPIVVFAMNNTKIYNNNMILNTPIIC